MFKAEILKGHLDFLILAVLEDRPAHGYAVVEALRHRSGGVFNLPEGTIYPALHRLEDAKFLTSRWSEVLGRRRRTYALTSAGHRALVRYRNEWMTFAQVVTAILQPAP